MGVLLNNPDILEEILLQHVVSGTVDSVTAFSLNGGDVPGILQDQIFRW